MIAAPRDCGAGRAAYNARFEISGETTLTALTALTALTDADPARYQG
jgi:hypothetical protein